MSSYAEHTRCGAKARRTTNQPIDRMASPENQQEHRHKTNQDQGSPKKGSQTHNTLARPDCTWAEAARASPCTSKTIVMLPTYQTVAKDRGHPYPFAINPHFLSHAVIQAAPIILTKWYSNTSSQPDIQRRGSYYNDTVRRHMRLSVNDRV